jgi:hypothetical protein
VFIVIWSGMLCNIIVYLNSSRWTKCVESTHILHTPFYLYCQFEDPVIYDKLIVHKYTKLFILTIMEPKICLFIPVFIGYWKILSIFTMYHPRSFVIELYINSERFCRLYQMNIFNNIIFQSFFRTNVTYTVLILCK